MNNSKPKRGRPRIKKPFFYLKELTKTDKIAYIGYIIISLLLSVFYFISGNDTRNEILIIYATSTQFVIYFFLYVSLRNFRTYLIWFSFSFIHLLIYFLIRNSDAVQMQRGAAVSPMKNTIILLLVFQLLRFISLKLQNREFVVPPKGGGKDLIENKSISATDYLILLIYIGSFGCLIFLSFGS